MKRIFNKMTRRLVSAFLVLAMVITFIPVTDAQAKKKDDYIYEHRHYCVDGSKTHKHKEEIINLDWDSEGYDSEYGLIDLDDGDYRYSLNADEVKQLIAKKPLSFHVDQAYTIEVSTDCTNVYFGSFFCKMSYTNEKGKRKDIKFFTVTDGGYYDYESLGAKFCAYGDYEAAGDEISRHNNKLPQMTDCDVTIYMPSKKVYLENPTRFEMPKGVKGKKIPTYRFFDHLKYKSKKPVDDRAEDEDKQARNNRTCISLDGLEEPWEFVGGKECESLFYYHPQYNQTDDAKPGVYTIRGIYTHRTVKFRIVYTTKKTGYLHYDKFKTKSSFAYSRFPWS